MRNERVFRSTLAGCAFGVVGACGGDGGAGSSGFIQVLDVTSVPNVASCGFTNPAIPYEFVAQTRIVNTTATDASVTEISSSGVIVGSTNATELGAPAHNFSTLPYTPEAALVRAKDGNVTLVVTFRVSCANPPSAPVNSAPYREFNTTIYVKTTAGIYSSRPFVMRTIWN